MVIKIKPGNSVSVPPTTYPDPPGQQEGPISGGFPGLDLRLYQPVPQPAAAARLRLWIDGAGLLQGC